MKASALLCTLVAALLLCACGKSTEAPAATATATAQSTSAAATTATSASAATDATAPAASAPVQAASSAQTTASSASSAPSASQTAVVDTAAGEALYKQACFACHDSGAAGAPKRGDKAAWAPRIAQGKDALYSAAIHGLNAMPPKGGTNASDAQIQAAVDYILAASH